MRDLIFYDAAWPPKSPPRVDGACCYIGGDTPHVWTKAEIDAAPARFRLPIYVRSDPWQHVGYHDAQQALSELKAIGAPPGIVVAWDTETAADPSYMRAVFSTITANGYKLLDYGSQDRVFGNDLPAGGYYWGAEWTGTLHIASGDAGTQYKPGADYDLSAFRPGLPFWDTHATGTPAHVSRETSTEAIVQQLPEISRHARGPAVFTAQAALIARAAEQGMNASLGTTGPNHDGVDGVFGPLTDDAVHAIQRAHHIAVDGIVGPQTWPVLLGIA